MAIELIRPGDIGLTLELTGAMWRPLADGYEPWEASKRIRTVLSRLVGDLAKVRELLPEWAANVTNLELRARLDDRFADINIADVCANGTDDQVMDLMMRGVHMMAARFAANHTLSSE